MNINKNLEKYLDRTLYAAVIKCKDIYDANEIRLRRNKPVFIRLWDREKQLDHITGDNELEETLNRIIEYSPYAHKEELNNGYITIDGGWRVGISGTVIEENSIIKNVKDISSLNIRIAREVSGCSDKIAIEKGNVIIISPPGCGKTTLLRDIIKRWSDNGKNIAVIDERNEISGSCRGLPVLNLGKRTDVIVNCSKKNGFNIALRALAPDVIAVDEIGNEEDFAAVRQAMASGTDIICTVHSSDIDELKGKSYFNKIIEDRLFDYYIVLNKNIGTGNIDKIYNKELNNIWQGK